MGDIQLARAGRVLVLTLDRPASRNAMSAGLVTEMLAALDVENDAGALVVTGAGRGFCAGSDLAGLAAMDAAGKRDFEAMSGLLARRLMAHRMPVVAAVHGFAIGGGLTLAAACDIVVTTAAAKWSLPEVPIGLFPAWGLEAVRLRVGRPAARRLAWGVESHSGEAAVTMGLADRVAAEPLEMAMAMAARLAELPAAQVAAVKDYFAEERTGEAADRHANALFMAACDTADFGKYGRK